MNDAIQIGSKILPIILLIALGHVLRRVRFIPGSTIPALKKLAIQLTLPLVVFLSLVELEFQAKYLVLDITIFLFTVAMLLVGFLIKKISGSKNLYLPNCFTSYENGMMGYGALGAVLGTTNIYPIVIMDLGQTVYFSLVFMTLIGILNRRHAGATETDGSGHGVRRILLSFITNPFVIVTATALILKGTGAADFIRKTPPLAAVLETCRLLSGLNTPIMCLVIGYELRIELHNLLKPLGVVVLRLALLLSGAALINHFIIDRMLHLEETFQFALYTMCMLPPFFLSAATIREEATEERSFVLNVISLNILIFLILFSLMSVFRGL
ncbi:MAG: hypothetical protein LBT39_07420 [Treponema sp.]|jgi:predicted permease|nr:hypothetical protein [Treponema sp.]